MHLEIQIGMSTAIHSSAVFLFTGWRADGSLSGCVSEEALKSFRVLPPHVDQSTPCNCCWAEGKGMEYKRQF